MLSADFRRALAMGAVSVGAVLLVAGTARAQDAGELESAGNEARFRVIDRLERRNEDESESTSHFAIDWRVGSEVRAGLERRDWGAVADRLADDGRLPEGTSERFVYAYTQEELEHWEKAYEAWKSVRGEMPALADYVNYFGAKAARRAGHLQDAVVCAAAVGRESRLYPWSLEVLARALLEKGTAADVGRARSVARAHLDHLSDAPNRSSMRMLFGRATVEAGEVETGAGPLFEVLKTAPLTETAEDAKSVLEEYRGELTDEQRGRLDSPSREMKKARFEALFEAHRNEEVVDELPSVVEEWTPGGRLRCRGLYWVGKSYSKLRDHEAAREWYAKILSECRGVAPFERKALYLDGKSAWNAGDLERALEQFGKLREKFADHSFADDAFYFAARIHREAGRAAEARELLREQLERHPEGDMAGDARWMLVEEMLGRGEYRQVVDYVDRLEESGDASEARSGRLGYFRARALEQLERVSKAKAAYRHVAEHAPFRVYGLLAANRFVRLETDQRPLPANLCAGDGVSLCEKLVATAEETGVEPTFELPASTRKRREFATGIELLKLGIHDWAAEEFRRLLDGVDRGGDAFWAVADLLHRAGEHHLAHRLPERVDGWRDVYPSAETERVWSIAYPRPYRADVAREVEGTSIASALVYAVMRKESGFAPGIRSWAGATGLMQLMDGTAREVARDVGLKDFDTAKLRRPATNIRLGVAYLNRLQERFGGHPSLTAAGYNAGAARVETWLGEHRELALDRWLEAIPFGQTRGYAKGILGLWWTYRWLEEGPVVPRVAYSLPNPD